MLQTDCDKWIHNRKDCTPRKGIGQYDNSICNTCGKVMYRCWDTICYICGDTSCYDHSHIVEIEGSKYGKHWVCQKCWNEWVVSNLTVSGIDLQLFTPII